MATEAGFPEISPLSPEERLLRRNVPSSTEGCAEASDALVTALLRMTRHEAAVEGVKRHYLRVKSSRPLIKPKEIRTIGQIPATREQAGYCAKSTRRLPVFTQGLRLRRGGIRESSGTSLTEEERNGLSNLTPFVTVHSATERVFTSGFCIFVRCFASQVEGLSHQH